MDILNKKHKSIPNLLIKEKKALKNLRNDTNIVITKADKGNCTVIIDKDKYEEKIFKLLNNKDTYVLIKNDLTKNIEQKPNKFIFDLYKIDRLSQRNIFICVVLMLLHHAFMGYQRFINQTGLFNR